MIEIRIQNVVSQVWNAPPQADQLLLAKLAYRQEGYIFAPSYKAGTWDGFVRLYNTPAEGRPFGKFWTGLLHRAVTALHEAGHEVRVVDERVSPQPQEPLPVKLPSQRYYQQGAVDAAVQCTRGIIRVATAGGKNSIAAMIMGRLNVPSMFIVHRISLLKQSKEEFEAALGQRVGVVQAGTRRLERFNVATVQTLDSALWSAADHELRDFAQNKAQLVLVDESHHTSSPSYRRVLGNFLSAYYRFGLSNNSHKYEGVTQSSDMVIEGAFGRVIHAADRQELTDQGYLAKAHVFYL